VGKSAATYQLHIGLFPDLQLVASYQPSFTSQSGIAVRKDDTELLNQINVALATLKANGTARTIFDEFALADIVAE